MTDLRELEKRLEEATEGQWWTSEEADRWTVAIFGPKATFVDWGMLTAAFKSLDAAVALVERVLPDAFPTIDRYSISDEPTAAQYNWRVWIKWVEGDDAIREAFSGTKSSPALALCLALIRALIAKGDHNE